VLPAEATWLPTPATVEPSVPAAVPTAVVGRAGDGRCDGGKRAGRSRCRAGGNAGCVAGAAASGKPNG
jgi:hypothetical protein